MFWIPYPKGCCKPLCSYLLLIAQYLKDEDVNILWYIAAVLLMP